MLLVPVATGPQIISTLVWHDAIYQCTNGIRHSRSSPLSPEEAVKARIRTVCRKSAFVKRELVAIFRHRS
eukprot:5358167-Alexandrium_andersonii.AAC.1